MKKNLFILIMSLMIVTLFPLHVCAENVFEVEIPVSIKDGGTVRIEGSEFMPSQTELAVQDDGVFKLRFVDPDAESRFHYRLSQVPGTDPNVIYDDKVYDVEVYFMLNSSRTDIYPVVIMSRSKTDLKPDVASWVNRRKTDPSETTTTVRPSEPTTTEKPSETTTTGGPSKPSDPDDPTKPSKPDDPQKPDKPENPGKSSKTADTSQPLAACMIFLMAITAFYLIRRKGGSR